MSNFTTELRYICEWLANENNTNPYPTDSYSAVNDIIEAARPKIFDFDYPTLNSATKQDIESDILRSFYFREIGFETYGRWKLALQCKMIDIMPYYNGLIQSAQESYNIILPEMERETIEKDDSYTKTGNRTTTGSEDSAHTSANDSNKTDTRTNNVIDSQGSVNHSDRSDTSVSNNVTTRDTASAIDNKNSNEASNTQKNYASDTPQNSITDPMTYMSQYSQTNQDNEGSSQDTNINAEEEVTSEDLTNRVSGDTNNEVSSYRNSTYDESNNSINNANSSDATSKNSSAKDESTETNAGNENSNRTLYSTGGKTPAEMVELYRSTLLKIHEMIKKELSPLFIGLWSS